MPSVVRIFWLACYESMRWELIGEMRVGEGQGEGQDKAYR
jgi:hypothetical protein